MEGAIYRGLFGLDSPVLFKCSSTCSWNETYVSLGFMSTCSDVTNATLRTVDASLFDSGPGAYVLTPGGVNLSAVYSATSYMTVLSVGARTLMKGEHWYTWAGQDAPSRTPVPERPYIARLAVLRTTSRPESVKLNLDTIEIVECDISLSASRLSDVRVSANALSIGKAENVPLLPGNPTSEGITVMLNQTGTPVLRISINDIFAISDFFESPRFQGNMYGGESPPSAPQGVGYAFRRGNMSEVVHNMTRSMTDQLRSTFNVTATGMTISPVVFVQARWEWLVAPIAVQLAGAVFLGLVLLRAAGNNDLQPWKSSSVALLQHQVVGETGIDVVTLHSKVGSLSELKEMAKSTKARLA